MGSLKNNINRPRGGVFGNIGDKRKGIDGINGTDGVEGPQGPQGLQGLKGDKGDKGDDGIQGPQGPQGVNGQDGLTGPQGLQGLQGPQGANGVSTPLISLGDLIPKYGDGTNLLDAVASNLNTVADVMFLGTSNIYGNYTNSAEVLYLAHGFGLKRWCYLSQTVPGGVTDVEPTTGIIQKLFFTETIDIVHVNIQEPFIVELNSFILYLEKDTDRLALSNPHKDTIYIVKDSLSDNSNIRKSWSYDEVNSLWIELETERVISVLGTVTGHPIATINSTGNSSVAINETITGFGTASVYSSGSNLMQVDLPYHKEDGTTQTVKFAIPIPSPVNVINSVDFYETAPGVYGIQVSYTNDEGVTSIVQDPTPIPISGGSGGTPGPWDDSITSNPATQSSINIKFTDGYVGIGKSPDVPLEVLKGTTSFSLPNFSNWTSIIRNGLRNLNDAWGTLVYAATGKETVKVFEIASGGLDTNTEVYTELFSINGIGDVNLKPYSGTNKVINTPVEYVFALHPSGTTLVKVPRASLASFLNIYGEDLNRSLPNSTGTSFNIYCNAIANFPRNWSIVSSPSWLSNVTVTNVGNVFHNNGLISYDVNNTATEGDKGVITVSLEIEGVTVQHSFVIEIGKSDSYLWLTGHDHNTGIAGDTGLSFVMFSNADSNLPTTWTYVPNSPAITNVVLTNLGNSCLVTYDLDNTAANRFPIGGVKMIQIKLEANGREVWELVKIRSKNYQTGVETNTMTSIMGGGGTATAQITNTFGTVFYEEVDVVFPIPFESVPSLQVTPQSLSTLNQRYFQSLVIHTISETGFKVIIWSSGSLGSFGFNWKATVA